MLHFYQVNWVMRGRSEVQDLRLQSFLNSHPALPCRRAWNESACMAIVYQDSGGSSRQGCQESASDWKMCDYITSRSCDLCGRDRDTAWQWQPEYTQAKVEPHPHWAIRRFPPFSLLWPPPKLRLQQDYDQGFPGRSMTRLSKCATSPMKLECQLHQLRALLAVISA